MHAGKYLISQFTLGIKMHYRHVLMVFYFVFNKINSLESSIDTEGIILVM